jgi:hypothetical protein
MAIMSPGNLGIWRDGDAQKKRLSRRTDGVTTERQRRRWAWWLAALWTVNRMAMSLVERMAEGMAQEEWW